MRTDPPSPHLDARPAAAATAPRPRSLATAAAFGEAPGARGAARSAPHGAERLAADRVLLLLPLQVPGAARRAREGAPGR